MILGQVQLMHLLAALGRYKILIYNCNYNMENWQLSDNILDMKTRYIMLYNNILKYDLPDKAP